MDHSRPSPRAAGRLRQWLMFAAGIIMLGSTVPRYQAALAQTVPWDLVPDLRMAKALIRGFDPYSTAGMERTGLEGMGAVGAGHPPTTALWALPLAGLPLRTAAGVLGLIVVLIVFGMLLVIARALGASHPVGLAWLAGCYTLACPFMIYHIGVGQMSAVIAGLLVGAWWAARRARDVLAGAALGAACTLKLFPGVAVLMFVFLGRWRVVGASVALYLIFAASVTLRFGWAAWPEFFARQGGIADVTMGSIQNQTLAGIVLRLFHPACDPASGTSRVSTAIAVVLSAAAVLLAAKAARRACLGDGRDLAPGNGFDVTFGLFTALAVLASQWAWEHYNVIYLLPVAIVTRALVSATRKDVRPRFVVVGVAVLVGVLGGWQLSATTRIALQASVRAGQHDAHVLMHVYELANWVPHVSLLALLFFLAFRGRADMSGVVRTRS